MKKNILKRLAAIGASFVFALTSFVGPLATLAKADDGLNGLAPGTVLEQVNVPLPAPLFALATAKHVTYISTDPNGNNIAVTGLVFTPTANQRNETVAWAHGTTGIAAGCAPSINQEVFYPEALSAVTSYIKKGWTVTAADYPGLGTTGNHPYLVGDSEARSVIDSVRAARNLNGSLSANWSVSGHSQGGHAAIFAGEISDTYAPELNLKGVVAIAPASNLDILAEAIPGTPGNGYLVLAIYGFSVFDPAVVPEEILAQPALDRIANGALENCGDLAIIEAFADLTAEELLVDGVVPESVYNAAAFNNPAQAELDVPLLIVQGTNDEVVPLGISEFLHFQECSIGTHSYLHVVEADHINSAFLGENTIKNFLQKTFENKPVPTNC